MIGVVIYLIAVKQSMKPNVVIQATSAEHSSSPVSMPIAVPDVNVPTNTVVKKEPTELYRSAQSIPIQEKTKQISSTKKATGIAFIKEQSNGQFFYLTKPSEADIALQRWDYDRMAVLDEFYHVYQDNFDFLIVFPMKQLESNNSMIINSEIKGIGLSPTHLDSDTTRLKALITIDMHSTFDLFKKNGPTDVDQLLAVFVPAAVHEIGHFWCCYSFPPLMMGAHYSTATDLFSDNMTYSDPMGYSRWTKDNNGNITCVNNNKDTSIFKFSKLSLYLMGLVSKSEVTPIEYNNYKKSDAYGYIGPYCGAVVEWLNTITYTIEDLIRLTGEREPSSETSEKSFNVGYIILGDENSSEEKDFVELVKLLGNQLTDAWKNATDNLSSLVNSY